jgi:sarcosine oxidase subunit gamma
MKVALRFNDGASESKFKSELALCDMSFLPKLGVKGPESLACLAQAQLPIPEGIYSCCPLADGGLVIRIDRHEVFVEDGVAGTLTAKLEEQLGQSLTGVSLIRRQDASFLLSGARCNLVLRETCGFDFRYPPNGVVMTRVAGVSCIILPVRIEGAWAFRLWLDPSYASYLWEALLKIVRDHGGDAIGLETFYPSLGHANSSKKETTHDT